MYRQLNDLRILRMAAYLEETLEGYEEMLRDAIAHVPVRARLAVLFQGGPFHHALKQSIWDLEDRTQALRHVGAEDTEGLLQSLLECERIAHDFYIDQLDHLSDPDLVVLFKNLAQEENEHARAVLDAIRILESLPSKPPRAGVAVRA